MLSKNYEVKEDEVIIKGKYIQAVVTLGSKREHESFENFRGVIMQQELLMTRFGIYLEDLKHAYRVNFVDKLIIDKKMERLQYYRYETPYVETMRYPAEVELKYQNQGLKLNLEEMTREVW
jgi:hypothetical protein